MSPLGINGQPQNYLSIKPFILKQEYVVGSFQACLPPANSNYECVIDSHHASNPLTPLEPLFACSLPVSCCSEVLGRGYNTLSRAATSSQGPLLAKSVFSQGP